MPRVVHFDIGVEDPERAIKLYTELLGWHIHKWEGPMDYWLITTGKQSEPGINGGLAKRQDPSEFTLNTIGIPSVDEFIEKITAAGGKVLQPKMAIPGVGWYTTCQDTEGNAFGLMEEDESAK
ncbi:MAG: glyoxalase [candidate division Zixibacteria bacterium SM23_81]|nr:MAG: glyoxalase [candidate division Zixibacteria bacterium SM23_81]